MKHYFTILCSVCCLILATTAHAQTNGPADASTTQQVNYKQPAKKSASKKTVKHLRKIPTSYTGYMIEIATSDLPLDGSDQVFKYFGKVHYDKVFEGWYSYFILVDFKEKEAVEKFLNNIVIHKAPKARIIEYQYGVRKEKGQYKEKTYFRVD